MEIAPWLVEAWHELGPSISLTSRLIELSRKPFRHKTASVMTMNKAAMALETRFEGVSYATLAAISFRDYELFAFEGSILHRICRFLWRISVHFPH